MAVKNFDCRLSFSQVFSLLLICCFQCGCNDQRLVERKTNSGDTIWLTYQVSVPAGRASLLVKPLLSSDIEGRRLIEMPAPKASPKLSELSEATIIQGAAIGPTLRVAKTASIASLKKAEQVLYSRLTEALKAKNRQDFSTCLQMLEDLSRYYLRCDDMSDATRVLESELRYAETFLGADDIAIAGILLNLEGIKYSPRKQLNPIEYMQNRQLLDRTYVIFSKTNDTKYDTRLAYILSRKAQINEGYSFLNRETASLYRQAVTLCERNKQCPPHTLKLSLIQEARFLTDTRLNLDTAYSDLVKALSITSSNGVVSDDQALVAVMSRLASTLQSEPDTIGEKKTAINDEKATKLYEMAYEHAAKTLGPSAPYTLRMLGSLVDINIATGKFSEAERWNLLRIASEKDDFNNYYHNIDLAYLLRTKGDFKGAELATLKSMECKERSSSNAANKMPLNIDRIRQLCQLVEIYIAQQDLVSAKIALDKSEHLLDAHMAQIRQTSANSNVKREELEAYSSYSFAAALIQIRDGNYENAEQRLKRQIVYLQKHSDSHTGEMYKCCLYLAILYDKLGRSSEAQSMRMQADALCKHVSKHQANAYMREALAVARE